MTRKKAERVMGLSVSKTGPNSYSAVDENDTVIATVENRNEKVAMDMLVQAVYRKRGAEVLADSAYRCARCGRRMPLHTHHEKHRSQGRSDAKSNLTALCLDCHDKAHGRKVR